MFLIGFICMTCSLYLIVTLMSEMRGGKMAMCEKGFLEKKDGGFQNQRENGPDVTFCEIQYLGLVVVIYPVFV